MHNKLQSIKYSYFQHIFSIYNKISHKDIIPKRVNFYFIPWYKECGFQ